jgi:hypothetical protein
VRKCRAPIYACFKSDVDYELNEVDGRMTLVFKCAWPNCKKGPVRRLTTGPNAGSTGNLRRHANGCWGEDFVREVVAARTVKEARKVILVKPVQSQKLTAAWDRVGGGKIVISTVTPGPFETR